MRKRPVACHSKEDIKMLRMMKFRVCNYKCIEDTGPIEADQITVLVGKNESGKTAVLQALHKFNPADEIPFDPLREFPRKRYTGEFSSKDWPVVSVRFSLPEDLQERLGQIDDAFASIGEVECTRHYSGHLEVAFDPPPSISDVQISQLLGWIDSSTDAIQQATVSGKGEELSELKEGLIQYLSSERATIEQEDQSDIDGSLERVKNGAYTRVTEEWHKEALAQPLSDLEEIIHARARFHGLDKAKELIKEELPVFIYFENYGILDSKVHLPTYLQQVRDNPSDPKVRTTRTMFAHTGLDPAHLERIGLETDEMRVRESEQIRREKDERAILTESASFDLTGKFVDWYTQRRHRIEFQLDGSYLRLWVSDDKDPSRIELEERSKGFQWFFSFYLVFLVESQVGHKDAILLLDEPGLHLHPTAQQELIAFLNKISQDNQLIYSTHSPFLIDGDHLERARACVELEDGTTLISEDVWPKDPDSIFPLQAALGYSIAQTLFMGQRNLVVEGITDFWILKSLSDILSSAGSPSLDPEIVVTPAGGAKKVSYLASLMLSQDVAVAVLLDSDEMGKRERSKLLKDLFVSDENRILLIGNVLDRDEADLEDIFPRDYYLSAVSDAYNETVSIRTMVKEEKEEPRIVKAVEANFERKGYGVFEKWRPARKLLEQWKDVAPSDLPEELVDNAIKLFQEINERIARTQASPN